MNETTPTHNDLERQINDLEKKIVEELGEIKVLLARTTGSHEEQLKSHNTRIGKLEDKAWHTTVGVAGGAIGILASIVVGILLLL